MTGGEPERLDRRVKRTQTQLAKALIALTLERGYAGITIRDITERADVGYATFFRHYTDKDSLLHDVLDVVSEELPVELTESSCRLDAAGAASLFEYVQRHAELLRVLLSTSTVRQRVIDNGVEQALITQDLPGAGQVPPEVAANFVVRAALDLIDWWLNHAMPYSPERMGEIFYALLHGPYENTPEREEPR